jgi:hypothetical protein
MTVPYYCPYCNQRSTRRWNLEVHMQRKHGEYLPVGPSGQYTPQNPLWIKRNIPYHDFGSDMVADSVGDTFQPRYIPQQAPMGTSPSTFRPPGYTMDNHRYGTGLSPDAIQKIRELKALMNKYPRYHENPDGVIRLAVYNSIKGDNTLLDDKLEQLRTIDSLSKY